jgi:hypothetical protein
MAPPFIYNEAIYQLARTTAGTNIISKQGNTWRLGSLDLLGECKWRRRVFLMNVHDCPNEPKQRGQHYFLLVMITGALISWQRDTAESGCPTTSGEKCCLFLSVCVCLCVHGSFFSCFAARVLKNLSPEIIYSP